MSSDTKETNKRAKKEPTFWEWLIHGKGTISEPWPTAEEFLADKEKQEKIQRIRSLTNKKSNGKEG